MADGVKRVLTGYLFTDLSFIFSSIKKPGVFCFYPLPTNFLLPNINSYFQWIIIPFIVLKNMFTDNQ